MKKTILNVCLSGVAALVLACSSQSDSNNEETTNRLIPAVEAVQAQHGALPLTARLSGVVRAKNQVEIYPQISSMITEVQVKNGDAVTKGQPLVRLRDREFRERLRQARAGYQVAVAQARQADARLKEIQAELQRTRTLAEKELVSPMDLEAIQTQAISAEADVELARARVEQAEAVVEEREEALSHTVIRAPVAGTVGNRNAEVGMLVSSNTRLFTMGKLDSLRVEIVLTDLMLSYIEEGQRAEIYSPAASPGLLSAPLSRISPFLHPVTHSTTAEIDIANPDGRLKSGMFVTVDVFYGESEEATLVPLSSLYENPVTGATGVFVTRATLNREPAVTATNSTQSIALSEPVQFEFVPIDVVAKGRGSAGIRGVEPGSWVVTLGQNLLGNESGTARVRPVNWSWVEQLQRLQRQDLLQEVMQRQSKSESDTSSTSPRKSTSS